MAVSLLRAVLAASLIAASSVAQALVFAVNEGVSYRVPEEEIRARFAAIAADIGKIMGEPVNVVPVSDYKVLRRGLADRTYDLALVHPAHVSIGALKQGWQLVAVTKGFEGYSASFLVRADAPFKSLADLRGRKVGAPDEDSITAWMVRATLRDAIGQAGLPALTYTRYQDAVPFMVEHTFAQAGATASTAVVRGWEAQGGKVLAKSRPVPIKHVIASPGMSATRLARLQEYFVGLDASEEGRRKLELLKVKGYSAYERDTLLELGKWLGV